MTNNRRVWDAVKPFENPEIQSESVERIGEYAIKIATGSDKTYKIVTYGGGVNSVALCILLTQQGVKLDYILFSNTLAEKPATYEYFEYFNAWLAENGQTTITVLPAYKDEGLYGECIRLKRLPSIAYGFKSCSEKWKIRPFMRFLKEKGIENYVKYVGYDAGRDSIRAKPREHNIYPLIEADLDRQGCVDLIKSVGLRVPPKSSCFFCPSMRKQEVLDLKKEYPNLFQLAVEMETNAELTTMKGLGRNRAWKDLEGVHQLDFKACETPCECSF